MICKARESWLNTLPARKKSNVQGRHVADKRGIWLEGSYFRADQRVWGRQVAEPWDMCVAWSGERDSGAEWSE